MNLQLLSCETSTISPKTLQAQQPWHTNNISLQYCPTSHISAYLHFIMLFLVRQPFKYVKHNYQALKVTNSFGIFSPQWKICLYHGYEIPLHNNFQQPGLADLVPHPKWQLILLSVWQSFLAELILIFNVFKYNSSFYQQVGSGAKGLYKNLAELRLLVMLRARCFRSTTDNHKLECYKQNKPLTVSLAPL